MSAYAKAISAAMTLEEVISRVPDGRAWMVRSIDGGKFSADVGGPPGVFQINRAEGATPQGALLNAITNSRPELSL